MRNYRRIPLSHLGGWLFADLLLVLFLVMMASLPPTAHQAVGAIPTPSGTATPRSAPVLELEETSFTVTSPYQELLSGGWRSSGAARSLQKQVDCELKYRGLQQRQAGFVLAFGTGSNDGDSIGRAKVAARHALELLKERTEFAQIHDRNYWSGGNPGAIEFQIFFFQPDAAHPQRETDGAPDGCPAR